MKKKSSNPTALRLIPRQALATAIGLASCYTSHAIADLPTDFLGNYASAGSGTNLNLTGPYDAIIATNGGTITSTGGLVLGSNIGRNGNNITAQGVGSSVVLSNGQIDSRGILGNGAISADSGATVELRNFVINPIGGSKGAIETYDASTSVLFSGGTYSAADNGLPFAFANSNSQIEVDTSTLSTSGANSGLLNSDGALINAHDSNLTTSGNDSVIASATNGGAILLDNNIMKSEGVDSIGISADGAFSAVQATGGTLTTTGSRAYAAEVTNNGSVIINNSSIETSGDSSHALKIVDGGEINVSNTPINATGANSSIILSTATSPSSANQANLYNLQAHSTSDAIQVQGSQLDLNVQLSRITAGNGVLVSATANSLSQGAVTNLNLIDSQIIGDINSDTLSQTSVNLTQSSSLDGAILNGSDILIDGSSRWNVTGDSSIRSLSQSGVIAFQSTPGFKVLTVVGDLSGNGRFLMNTDLSTAQGDLLVVQGQTTGTHTLVVADSGREPARAGGQLNLVNSQGGSGQFELLGGHVDAGAFRYTLERNGNDWSLVNPNVVDPTPCESNGSCPTIDPEPEPEPQDLSKGANAAVAMQTARAALWNAEVQTLTQRFGDLRMGKDQGGVWVRAMDSRYNFDTGTSRSFDQNIHGLKIGADKAVGVASGHVYLGGFVGIAESRQDFGESSDGSIDSRTVGAYATYLDDGGAYIDAVAQLSRYDNDLTVTTNLGTRAKGSYDSNAYGMSLEVGKRFKLEREWFVEPQAQLSSGRIQGGKYTSTDGLQVDSDSINTLQSRVGGVIGKTITFENGTLVEPYFKTSWITEHRGDSAVKVNNVKLKSELPGDHAVVGFGGTMLISSEHSLSLDAEYAKGNGIEKPWGVALGYRFKL